MLEVLLLGPEDGVPIFTHHGTPGCAGMFDALVEIGAERNLRHIAYSRPGYGGSSRDPGRSVASCAADVAAIADTLGYERFHCIGASGGAPHSIACAALLPERVISAAAIATPAPLAAEGLDWAAGMGPENLAEIAAMQAGDDEFQAFLEREVGKMRRATADDVITVLGELVSEVDRRAVSPVYARHVVAQFAHAMSGGVWGWFDDDRALFLDWGFDLHEVGAPLVIWHGVEDLFVPVAHGAWLADNLNAKAELREGHGHLSLTISSYGEILDGLIEVATLHP